MLGVFSLEIPELLEGYLGVASGKFQAGLVRSLVDTPAMSTERNVHV